MNEPFLGPLSAQPIVERLRSAVPALRAVGGAADFEAVRERGATVTPAAWCLLGAGSPQKALLSSRTVTQSTGETFGVIVAQRDHRYEEAGASEDAIAVIRQVRRAVIGWTHPDAPGAVMTMGGTYGVWAFKDSVLYWHETYLANYHTRTAYV